MRFGIIFVVVLLLSGCATHQAGVSSYERIDPKAFSNSPPVIEQKHDFATLVIKRDYAGPGEWIPAKISIDGLYITNIKKGQYIEVNVEPGSHQLLLRTNGLALVPFSHELQLDAVVGSTNYYRIHAGWPDGMQLSESPD